MTDEKNNIEFKFSFLGDSMVGKTTIFKKLTTGNFQSKTLSTVGVDKRTIKYENIEVNIDGKPVNKSFDISLFDTAGQEKFRAITKNYINGSDGIILIYDITRRQSFENIEMWLESITDCLEDYKNSDYLIMLLGNKLDLVKEEENKREISTEEGEKKSKESGLYWGGECSAKDFSESDFKALFANLVKKIYEKVGDKKEAQNIKITTIKSCEQKKEGKKKCC